MEVLPAAAGSHCRQGAGSCAVHRRGWDGLDDVLVELGRGIPACPAPRPPPCRQCRAPAVWNKTNRKSISSG
jgi:hypothetical protein